VWLWLPLALSAVFGLTAPGLARRLPPSVATFLLSGGGLLAAAASSVSIALAGFLLVARSPAVETRGHWSTSFLRGHAHAPTPIGLAAVAAVVLLSARFAYVAGRRIASMRAAAGFNATLPDTGGALAVVDGPERLALAVPGLRSRGRVVVTSGLLRSLDADHRRALLAHERAHLKHRHHLHQTAAALAVAVNPLLARLPAALELSCERWADEAAARTCPRATVADALTRAATGQSAGRPSVVLAAGATDVLARVGALHAPAPRLASWRLAVLTALLFATTVAAAVALHDADRLFDLARSAYRAGRR
jgi:Zn-dependent protease with chaperone function